MNIYIVYENQFSVTNPKCKMARPSVLLITVDESKAIKKVNELEYEMRRWNDNRVYSNDDNSFDFHSDDNSYGRIGIIEKAGWD